MFYNNYHFVTKPTNCIVDSYSDHNFMHSFDVMIGAPCGDDELGVMTRWDHTTVSVIIKIS